LNQTDEGQPLRGKVALVTGASGGGVGSTTASLLGARGAAVLVHYFQHQAAAEQVAGGIVAGGGRAQAVQGDVGDREQVERLVATAVDAYGRLDILVNNASARRPPASGRSVHALGARSPGFLDWTWEQFSQAMNERLQPAFLVTQAAVRVMRQQGSGRLIYVGSDHADGPAGLPGMIANGTSAAALVAFVRYLAHELGPDGITANVVSPGGIDSPGSAQALAAMGLPPGIRERMAASVPLRRMATPRDVAGAIAFYASDDAAFMTGTVAHVNGGFGLARTAAGPLEGWSPPQAIHGPGAAAGERFAAPETAR
jgi:3-oxoacyl-[acyl-carrier protein] reductase